MTVEFEHRDILGRVIGTPQRLFSQSNTVLDERSVDIHGVFSVSPARAVHAESDNAVSFADWSKGRIPYMNTGLSGELRRQEINDANLRTRRDRLGRYSVIRWRQTTGRDMDEELERFGRFLPNTQSDIAHEITLQVAHNLAFQALRSRAEAIRARTR